MSGPGPLDDQHPFDEADSAAQVAALLALLGRRPRRILDLGCGEGRTLLPLLRAGHAVTGIDRDERALVRCRRAVKAAGSALAARCRLVRGDFTRPWRGSLGAFDYVCCLGNTIMTVVEIEAAIALLARAAAVLERRGAVIIDDCPGAYVPELTGGNWQNGVSEDGKLQMVWAADDTVFALRRGRQIDRTCWTLRPRERRYRLWTMADLALVARSAGLSAPARGDGGGLLVMRRAAKGRRSRGA